MTRLPSAGRKVRVRAPGFVDRTSCPDDKLAGIPAGHPAGYSSTRPPLSYGDPESQERRARAIAEAKQGQERKRRQKQRQKKSEPCRLANPLWERTLCATGVSSVSLRRFVAHRVRSHRKATDKAAALCVLSPLRFGALRSAMKYSLCGGGGCQATTRPNRSGLSHRNATSPGSKGHSLWVTFLLGQQEKSDSSGGSRSKRPLRKRPGRDNTATEGPTSSPKSRAKSLDDQPTAIEKHFLLSQEWQSKRIFAINAAKHRNVTG